MLPVTCWLATQDLVLRFEHAPGEKLFVDYAGQTIQIVDRYTGELCVAQIFVAAAPCARCPRIQHPLFPEAESSTV